MEYNKINIYADKISIILLAINVMLISDYLSVKILSLLLILIKILEIISLKHEE